MIHLVLYAQQVVVRWGYECRAPRITVEPPQASVFWCRRPAAVRGPLLSPRIARVPRPAYISCPSR